MKVKPSESTGPVLDWMVQQALLAQPYSDERGKLIHRIGYGKPVLQYSSDWAQGGPIIEQEKIDTYYDIYWVFDPTDPDDNGERWFASSAGDSDSGVYGATKLQAGLRWYVISKLGDEVEVPDELLEAKCHS